MKNLKYLCIIIMLNLFCTLNAQEINTNNKFKDIDQPENHQVINNINKSGTIDVPNPEEIQKVSNEELEKLGIKSKNSLWTKEDEQRTTQFVRKTQWFVIVGILIGMISFYAEYLSRKFAGSVNLVKILSKQRAFLFGTLFVASIMWLLPTSTTLWDTNVPDPIYFALMGFILFLCGWICEEDARECTVPTFATNMGVVAILTVIYFYNKELAQKHAINTLVEVGGFFAIVKGCEYIYRHKTKKSTRTEGGKLEDLVIRKETKKIKTIQIGTDEEAISINELISGKGVAIAESLDRKTIVKIDLKKVEIKTNNKKEIIYFDNARIGDIIVNVGVQKLTVPRRLMGSGDFNILALSSTLLGLGGGFCTLAIGSLCSLIIEMTKRKLSKDKKEDTFPFGPYLIGSCLLLLTFGRPILNYVQTDLFLIFQ